MLFLSVMARAKGMRITVPAGKVRSFPSTVKYQINISLYQGGLEKVVNERCLNCVVVEWSVQEEAGECGGEMVLPSNVILLCLEYCSNFCKYLAGMRNSPREEDSYVRTGRGGASRRSVCLQSILICRSRVSVHNNDIMYYGSNFVRACVVRSASSTVARADGAASCHEKKT